MPVRVATLVIKIQYGEEGGNGVLKAKFICRHKKLNWGGGGEATQAKFRNLTVSRHILLQ